MVSCGNLSAFDPLDPLN